MSFVWPIGLKYKPSKEDFVGILKKKIGKDEIQYEKIVVLDSGSLYSNTPDVLFRDKEYSYKNKFVVVTNRIPNGKGGFIRHLPSRFCAAWVPCGPLRAILARDTDAFIGVSQKYQFCYGKGSFGRLPTSWYMEEIETVDPPNSPLAISVVFELPQPDVAAAFKALKSAQKTVRRAKKTRFLADYQAMRAAKITAHQALEAAESEKLFNEARLMAQDASKKHKEQQQRLLQGALKRKHGDHEEAGPSNQQVAPARKIKLRVICSKSAGCSK